MLGDQLTRSGSHKPSATPYSLSVAVPATAKSLGVVIHPILEIHELGLFSHALLWYSRVHGRDEGFWVWLNLCGLGDTGNYRFQEPWTESTRIRSLKRRLQMQQAHRFSYSVLERRCVNVFGVISLSSFMRYMFTRNLSCSRLRWDVSLFLSRIILS